eukprot:PITA_28938
MMGCHECQLFQGKNKLLPFPLKPVEVNAPFQQSGLNFIGEIHPTSLGKHRWILTATDYFTKWIEAIPIRQATDTVIIQFLKSNILSHFGCPHKIIIDNVAEFKSKNMVEFCNKYNIILGHSMTYYPQGNRLAESSNKSLVNIIKKMLEANKKNWHLKLCNALWADRVSSKKSVAGSKEDDIQRRINQMIHLQQIREEAFQNTFRLQEKIKKIYDHKTKAEKFQLEDVVLQWDARNEEK